MAKIGVLTGGGDCPGLNAVIRGIVVRACILGHEVLGLRRGYRGLMDGGRTMELSAEDVEDIHVSGGTILGSSMLDPYQEKNGEKQVIKNYKRLGLDCLIVVGGEMSLRAAAKLSAKGVNVIAVPKTLDNNVAMTDYTFGFATASNVACEAIERLQTSAQSRERIVVVEVIGLHSGWTALYSGLGAGASYVAIPEFPFDLKEICELIQYRRTQGKPYSIIVVAEGAQPNSVSQQQSLAKLAEKHGEVDMGHGVAAWLAQQIKRKLKVETQSVILGHVQRGGIPTAFDRVLGMRLGAMAADLAEEGKFGLMTALRGARVESVDIMEAAKTRKLVDCEFYEEIKTFFS
ncbi:ATP-dependent 6-phosphofructokinase [Candidatus Sumerlaeota bacterium]|nr:ATP-dependent 6-phosphofructokinase [Candidatus Sumerlaeota bacterium]